MTCTACPAGYKCPLKGALPSPCEAGTYSLGASANCTACDAGSQCTDATSAPSSCLAGQYSPEVCFKLLHRFITEWIRESNTKNKRLLIPRSSLSLAPFVTKVLEYQKLSYWYTVEPSPPIELISKWTQMQQINAINPLRHWTNLDRKKLPRSWWNVLKPQVSSPTHHILEAVGLHQRVKASFFPCLSV